MPTLRAGVVSSVVHTSEPVPQLVRRIDPSMRDGVDLGTALSSSALAAPLFLNTNGSLADLRENP